MGMVLPGYTNLFHCKTWHRFLPGIFMSASLGLAAILPTEDMNMDWYYHQADQGLDKARQSGKNSIGIV
jgi:PleD family two-component response regulator